MKVKLSSKEKRYIYEVIHTKPYYGNLDSPELSLIEESLEKRDDYYNFLEKITERMKRVNHLITKNSKL